MELLRTLKTAVAWLALATLASPLPAIALSPADAQREYAVKSVFLYNFCRFIEWPREAFGGPAEPLIIGVIGDDPFGPLLNEAVQGERMRGRPIRIERYRRASEIERCHLLFVSASEAARLDEIFATVSGKSVVTVGETEEFLDHGGMIALTKDRERVRLRVNPARLRAASLSVSSKLLSVAEIKS